MRESIQRGLGLVVLFLCLGPTCAEATDNGRNGRQSEPSVNSTSNTSSNSSSFSASGSFSAAEGGQATGGSAEATGGHVGNVASTSESSGGNASSNSSGGEGGNASIGNVVVEAVKSPGSVKIKNTPTVVASDVYPTVPCFRTGAIAGSGPGLGFSWGGGKIDKGCESREEIRLAASFGLIDRALYRWCQLPNNIESFGSLEKCLEFDATPEPIAAYETIADEPMLLAEVTEEQFEAAVENARIREEKQALLMAELLQRLKEQEKAQKKTDQLEDYRQQALEEYKLKYDEPEDGSNG